jgi:hypothetical protein
MGRDMEYQNNNIVFDFDYPEEYIIKLKRVNRI